MALFMDKPMPDDLPELWWMGRRVYVCQERAPAAGSALGLHTEGQVTLVHQI